VTIEVLNATGRIVRFLLERRSGPAPSGCGHCILAIVLVQTSTGALDAAGMHRFMWDVHYQPLSARMPAGSTQAASTPWVSPELHRKTHGQRQELYPADRGQARSALEKRCGRDAAAVLLDRCDVFRRRRRRGRPPPAWLQFETRLQSCSRRRSAVAQALATSIRRAKRSGRGFGWRRRPWRCAAARADRNTATGFGNLSRPVPGLSGVRTPCRPPMCSRRQFSLGAITIARQARRLCDDALDRAENGGSRCAQCDASKQRG